MVRIIGVDAFTSAWIARLFFLLCAGIILPLTLFGNAILCFDNFVRVTVSLFTGCRVIQGNEVADKLARIGNSSPFTGPERALRISSNLIRNTVFDIFRKKQYLN